MFGEISSEQLAVDAAPGILTIDLGALAANYRALQARVGAARVAGVVKADAYGLGALRVAPALYAAGCRDFFVAHLSEARVLRPALGPDARLYVLNGLQPGAEPAAAEAGIVPVLNSLEQIERWSRLAGAQRRTLPALLQFDTGMSRLGLAPDEVEALIAAPARLEGVRVLHVMSHLASADEPDNAQNAAQLVEMQRFARAFPGVEMCFANSGGVFLGPDYHGTLVRPGIALYGGAPVAGIANPMAPVVRLEVRVIQTRAVPAGARVGYGGAHVTVGERRLATIAAGYADGVPRHLSDRGAAYLGATRLPMVGRVSMDSLTLDVTELPPGTLRLGSLVELIGPHQTLEDMASAAGTIAYEILTRLGTRYHRVYR
ncbi:alanine racemase [Angulomicrobium tetraedrale]|uniref:Alanine racemase n=1 Tax=Ancylobacter tetraedralis TaxID=217068 RepID=A0A839ZA99_9HYPH|nr:alanine racemase [Ancylobacter tetraedralis]MBB3771680.1 alanine racemase [Ancylobacter tetraedralis]